MSELHLNVYGRRGDPAIFVHGTFGWGLDTFPQQLELADTHRIILVDRRGFGDSPPAEEGGWPTDMHDLARLLEETGPAHLVGQSYGGVVCLLAAGLRPELVRSLVAIEPPAFEVAPHDEAARERVRLLKPVYEGAGTMTAARFYTGFMRAFGATDDLVNKRTAAFTPQHWTAAEASRKEPWPGDAPIPFEGLARAAFPKALVHGGWHSGQFPNREWIGRAFRVVCETIAAGIGGEVAVFDGSSHNPQLEEPGRFNEFLRALWRCG